SGGRRRREFRGRDPAPRRTVGCRPPGPPLGRPVRAAGARARARGRGDVARRHAPGTPRGGRARPPRARNARHHRKGRSRMTANPRADVAPDAATPAIADATATPATTDGAAEVATLSPGTQRTVLFGMVAFVFLGAFEALAVATAMPTVAVALDGLTLYTLAFAASLASSVVGMVASGRWSDRAGPTTPLWTGIGLFLAGLLVAGLATDMLVLVAGRVLQGVGTGLYIVALYVLVARVFPADRRPKVFAAFAAAWVVPSIVGPAIAGRVVEHVGWRWVFLAVPVLAVPALVLMRPGMRAARSTGDDAGSPDAGEPALDRTARQASLAW